MSVDLRNWLFALEGAAEMIESSCVNNGENSNREDRSWHTTFKSLKIKAKNSPKPKDLTKYNVKSNGVHRYPVELITVRIHPVSSVFPKTRFLQIPWLLFFYANTDA